MRRLLYIMLLAVLPCALGQYIEPPPMNPDPLIPVSSPGSMGAATQTPSATPASANAPVPREKTRVAVLGYHNFSETKPVTEMLMRTSEFRSQMEYIRSAGLRVISMQEFLDWRLGTLQLPERCVLITLDDGWRSVYTDAYPILREFGYPFTLFLYTKYLTGRGDSMTPAMIREMQAHGATIGSHSTSHLYPKSWKEAEAAGEETNNALMDTEMGASFRRLSSLFGPIRTYCYPGGYVTQAMLNRLPGYGYEAAFGVVGGKVTCDEDVWQIHRYMVFGNNPEIFDNAMNFDGRPKKTASVHPSSPPSPIPPFPVFPMPNAKISVDIPLISARLETVKNIDLSSVRMSVSGFGRVPVQANSSTSSVQWAPPFRIYLPTVTVRLTWKTFDGTPGKTEWFFHTEPDVAPQP